MRSYERPVVILTNDMAEGVYAASGDQINPTTNAGCDSVYMKGVWHKSDYSNWSGGTNIDGRGCEGCPANWSDGQCHAANYQASEDCRPSWEKQGKLPQDKWNQ